jgi:predicted nucleic acid-binding protein
MGVMLDSSVLIAAERGKLQLPSLLDSLGAQPVGISAVTAAELLHGCYRGKDAGIRARRFAFVEALLELIPIRPFGLVEARRHAEVWAELAKRGMLIGAHDMQIGATALARGDALATLNTQDFARIPGLRLVPLEHHT